MTQAEDERLERRLAIVAMIVIVIIILVDLYWLWTEILKRINPQP